MTIRLAMVTPFPEQSGMVRGGVEGAVFCLIAGLMKFADLDIHVVAPTWRRKSGVEQRGPVHVHWLNMPALPACISNWSVSRRYIHRYLAAISPDMTHFQGVASWLIGYHKPCVLTVHGIYERDMRYIQGPLVSLRRKVVAFSETIGRSRSPNTIVISPYVLAEIGKHMGGRYWNIGNPVTRDFFEIERKDAGPRVLFAGHVAPRKNVHGLLRAFSELRRAVPGATLHIAGAPETTQYHQYCRGLVGHLGLGGTVTFLGQMNRTEFIRELGEATCLALVSYQETAPMVVIEAMAAGVPAVASRICGLPYMIENGHTGYLVEPDAVGETAACLTKLLTSRPLSIAMGSSCRETARRTYHVDRVAQQTLAVYQDILGSQAPRFSEN
jgi:glycosyltransferase involved in cell wall biosynthesis